MRFFNLGAPELILIFLFAILAIGPKDTLKFAGQIREMVGSVRGVLSELTSEATKIASEVMEEPTSGGSDTK